MLEAEPVLDDGSEENSSLSSHNASRCSTPSISHFDGTPCFLLPNAQHSARRRTSSPTPDMAIKPVPHLNNGHNGPETFSPTEPALSPPSSVSALQPVEGLPLPSYRELYSKEPVSRHVPSVADLAQSFLEERYQSRRGRQIRVHLHNIQISLARTSRLLNIARSAQHTLAECIRSEDKQSFTNLYSVFHDAVANCVESAHGSPENPSVHAESSAGYRDSFVDALPHSQRSTLLELFSRVRGDRSFLADRLDLLTQSELLALIPGSRVAKSSESVFESSVRSASRASRHLGYVVDSQTDQLTALEYSSPLEVLVQATRSLEQGLEVDYSARSVWATVCDRLISNQKRGSEKIVPAVIDLWTGSSPWPGRKRLEEWIGQALHDGAFLMEQPSRQSFRVRVQGRQDADHEEERKAEAFLSKAVQSFLELVADPHGASVIPEGAIILCQEICSRMHRSPGQQDAFCNFVLTRWLFNSFAVDAVTLPETHGMATARFITDIARHRILREVMVRTQRIVFNVLHPWYVEWLRPYLTSADIRKRKHSSPVPSDLERLVHAIAGRFRPVEIPQFSEDTLPSFGVQDSYAAMSITDASALIDVLYPQRRPSSVISDPDVARSGLHSSASSASGFSLFPSPNSSSTTLAFPLNPSQNTAKQVHTDAGDFTEGLPHLADSMKEQPQAEMDIVRLREVRATIEDMSVSGRTQSFSQLAIICFKSSSGTAATQAMRLKEAIPKTELEGIPSEANSSRPADHQVLSEILQHLLGHRGSTTDVPSPAAPAIATGTWLLHALSSRVRRASDQGDFIQAHLHTARLQESKAILCGDHSEELLEQVLVKLRDEALSFSRGLSVSIEQCDLVLKTMTPALENAKKHLQDCYDQCRLLRDKMVFTADVRTTAAYDEVRSIASALAVMGKPRKLPKTRMAPPLRHWPGPKASSNNLHLKTEAQILELLSAAANHGGPNKLSDDQSKALTVWYRSHEVQNLCLGEERLQKLCMEVRKAVDLLTADSSPLWSSLLFVRDRQSSANGQTAAASGGLWSPQGPNRFDMLRLHTHLPASRDAMSSTASSHPLSAQSSRDFLETRSPTLASKSSAAFWSPSMSEAISPSSTTSIGSSHARSGVLKEVALDESMPRSKHELQADLRKQITSLLLSEVTATIFIHGSETDQAFWTGLGGELAEKHLSSLHRLSNSAHVDILRPNPVFDFQSSFESLARSFSVCCDPNEKLKVLVDIDTLLGLHKPVGDERLSPSDAPMQHRRPYTQTSDHTRRLPISDAKVKGFRRLFCDRRTRPSTIFRDLQYIAALVPAIAAEYSSRSMAFWHASLAITGLKREICNLMVETADSIIAYHSNNRGHGRSPSTAQQQRDSAAFSTTTQTPPAEDIAKYSMADAAHLLQITAKEGDAVAQRELATLYLTNPELMDHIIAPLARPREVFKEELESKWRKNQDPTRCDPVTMCVAHHWMSLSAQGGDSLAKEYLKQREEMERLP